MRRLANRSFAPWLKALARNGYRIDVLFLWLESADLAVARVATRVQRGGHDVPGAGGKTRSVADRATWRRVQEGARGS
jgi:predicted ABC-type ATPase